jgi:hypothetical protein
MKMKNVFVAASITLILLLLVACAALKTNAHSARADR